MTTIAILSPHLDDAALSLGGTIDTLRRNGVGVKVITLFAGDLQRKGPPSSWDSKRGFHTAAETFRARRDEDLRAMQLLQAEYVWLPFVDAAYLASRDPATVWDHLAPHLADIDVCAVPGTPLSHPDHEYTTSLAIERVRNTIPMVFYAEYPYCTRPAHLRDFQGRLTPASLRDRLGVELVWHDLKLTRSAARLKREAIRCYGGEIDALGWKTSFDRFAARLVNAERVGCGTDAALPEIFQELQ